VDFCHAYTFIRISLGPMTGESVLRSRRFVLPCGLPSLLSTANRCPPSSPARRLHLLLSEDSPGGGCDLASLSWFKTKPSASPQTSSYPCHFTGREIANAVFARWTFSAAHSPDASSYPIARLSWCDLVRDRRSISFQVTTGGKL
jgi:hypothetical protein